MRDQLRADHAGTLSANASTALPQRIVDILPEAQAIAETKVTEVNELLSPHIESIRRQFSALQNQPLSRRVRVARLRALAAEYGAIVAPVTACTKQACSHCCHIPVALFETEAEMIGKAIGRTPKTASKHAELSQEYGYHRPCPFLQEGRCSIYEHRPLACRLHMNLDQSDRLCELIPEATVPVPLADVSSFQVVYTIVCGGEALVDIRDYFPAEPAQG